MRESGDELNSYRVSFWQRIVLDRQMWKQQAETFVQPLWLHNDDDES